MAGLETLLGWLGGVDVDVDGSLARIILEEVHACWLGMAGRLGYKLLCYMRCYFLCC